MTAGQRDAVRRWLERAQKQANVTHVPVAQDTFDGTVFPIFVREGSDVLRIIMDTNAAPMSIVKECFSMGCDIERQLREGRAWNV